MLFVTFMLQDGNAWCGPLVHYHSGKEHTSISSWCFLETVIFDCNVDLPEAPFVFPCFSTLLMVKVMHGQASIWAISRLDLLVVNLDGGASHGFDGLDWLRPEMTFESGGLGPQVTWEIQIHFQTLQTLNRAPKDYPKKLLQEWYWFHCPAYRSGQWWRGNLQNDFGRSEVVFFFFFPGVWWHKKVLRVWSNFRYHFQGPGWDSQQKMAHGASHHLFGTFPGKHHQASGSNLSHTAGLHPAPAWRMTTARRHWTTADAS